MSGKNGGVKPITVTVDKAALMTGLGRTTIFDLLKKQHLQSVKLRGRRLILVDSLLRPDRRGCLIDAGRGDCRRARQGHGGGRGWRQHSARRRPINDRNTGSIAKIKATVDITDVVGRYTTLQHRRGGYWFLCPLHQEKTASFKVDPARQTYHCFGCGERGDVIDFIMAAEHLDLRHALVRLRELAGGAAPDPATLAARTADRAAAAARGALKAERHTAMARRILAEALPLTALAARPAVAYLVERRGVPEGHALSPLVPLRYHPACPFEGERVGCIVAPVQNLAGEITAVWRIRLVMEGKRAPSRVGAEQGLPRPRRRSRRLRPPRYRRGRRGRAGVLGADRHPLLGGILGREHGRGRDPPDVQPGGHRRGCRPGGDQGRPEAVAAPAGGGPRGTRVMPEGGKDANDVLRARGRYHERRARRHQERHGGTGPHARRGGAPSSAEPWQRKPDPASTRRSSGRANSSRRTVAAERDRSALQPDSPAGGAAVRKKPAPRRGRRCRWQPRR